jgi:hypothetical protein
VNQPAEDERDEYERAGEPPDDAVSTHGRRWFG